MAAPLVGEIIVEPAAGDSVVVSLNTTAYTTRDLTATHTFPETITTRTTYFITTLGPVTISTLRGGTEVATANGAKVVSLGYGQSVTVTPVASSDFSTAELDARYLSAFDVKAIYGAKGDGTTDDTAAIQAADDAAAAAGGSVFFPGTTSSYYLASTINKSPKTVWEGVGNNAISTVAGSLLRYYGEGVAISVAGPIQNVRGRIKGIRLTYAGSLGAATTSTGIAFTSATSTIQDQILTDCYIGSFKYNVTGVNLSALYLDRCYLFSPTDTSLSLTDCTDVWIQNGSQCSGPNYGIYNLRSSSLHIEDSRPQSSGIANIYVEDTGFFAMNGGSCDSATIAASGSKYGLYLKNVNYYIVNGVTFYSNGTDADILLECTTGKTMLSGVISNIMFKTGGGSKKAIRVVGPIGTMRGLVVSGCAVDNTSEPLLSIGATAGGTITDVTVVGNDSEAACEGLNYVSSGLSLAGNSWETKRWQAITADTTLTVSQTYMSGSTGSGNVTLTLPATPYDGLQYVIKKTSSSNTLTVNGNSHNIDGAATIAMTLLYDTITVLWDSANSVWRVTGRGTTATARSGMVRRSSDATAVNNSTALVSDDTLLVPVSASTSVQFRFVLFVSGGSTAATADFITAITVPSGTTFRAEATGPSTAATALSSLNDAASSLTTSGTASNALGLINSSIDMVVVEGCADIGSTAGNIGIQYAQSVATVTDVIIKAFSNVTWQVT